MKTDRRNMLVAMAAAPALAAGATAYADVRNLEGLDVTGLLERGTRCGDPEFVRLCSDALAKQAQSAQAYELFCEAEDAAHAAAPPPPALVYTREVDRFNGEAVSVEEIWMPDRRSAQPLLQALAIREAERRSVPYSRGLQQELRGQYEGWRTARDKARLSYRVDELNEAQNAADAPACDAMRLLLAHRASSTDVLLVKLWLRVADDWPAEDAGAMAEIAAEVGFVLGLGSGV